MRTRTYLEVAVLVVLLLVALVTYYQRTGGPGTNTGSENTNTSVPTTGPLADFMRHLANLQEYSSMVFEDYATNATVIWNGNTSGIGGTYTGAGNIRLLYDSTLLQAKGLTLVSGNPTIFENSTTVRTLLASINFTGESQFLGAFNGSVRAKLLFQAQGGAWKIVREQWTFAAFNTSASGGATTFPEWQAAGPDIPSRRSRDWLHNLAWDYGGPAVAILVCAYSVILAILALGPVTNRKKKNGPQVQMV